MNIQIQIQGMDKFGKRLDKKKFDSFINATLFRVGNYMETQAKTNIKKSVYSNKIGNFYKFSGKALQSIIFPGVQNKQSKVFVGVKYAKYLETGTGIYNGRKPFWTTFGSQLDRPILYKGMKARPFWNLAIESTKKEIPKIQKEIFNKF